MAMFIPPGTIIDGKYRVESLIGEGGMGIVVRAHHTALDEPVAIKLLRPEMLEKEEVVQRFLREARSSVKLKGNHVARVVDVGSLPDTGIPYIVMEYLQGADLGAILRAHGAQNPWVAADLMLQACQGIAEAHALGIVHRDIKAGNFFITEPPNQGPILKVLDFGIATAPQGTSDLTSTQSVMGTPAYMAPEQMRASRLVDARSDIWSIGVVLYELLEGARPFRTDVYSELVLRVAMEPPVPITQPDVPEGLCAVVYRCLEKSVEKRYQTVADLAYDLVQFTSDPMTAKAGADHCARVLGLRTSGPISSPRITPATPYDAQHPPTPTPWQAAKQRVSQQRMPTPLPRLSTPIPTANAHQETILGQPTPLPSKRHETPSSISASAAEVVVPIAPTAPKKRSGALLGLAGLLVVGAAVAVFIVMSSKNEVEPATSPAPTATTTPEPAAAPPTAPATTAEPAPAPPTSAPTPPPPAASAATEPKPAGATDSTPTEPKTAGAPETAASPTKTPHDATPTKTAATQSKKGGRKIVAKAVKDPKAAAGKGATDTKQGAGSGDQPGGELFIKRQ